MQALEDAGGDPSGSHTPQWSIDTDDQLCDSLNIGARIFSMTSPGPAIAGPKGSIKLARHANEYLASLRDRNPANYGFFAAMPDLTETQAVLAEIEYSFDHLGADGVILMTRYSKGNMYLGHKHFKYVWEALDERHAVVLVHPTHPVDTNLVAKSLPQPIIDYPHETTRTAVDLVMSNRVRSFKNVKIILAHAGGTLPYLAKRAALVGQLGLSAKVREEILEDIGSFYFDLALSSSKATIDMLLQYTNRGHLMYGSDYPYAPPAGITAFADELDGSGLDSELQDLINWGNASKLFSRFKDSA
jgi:6-methylsalicylate decarboxylase